MDAESGGRSGSYVQQPMGYRAFVPKSLPPQPPVRMDGEMWMLLSEADRALGRLDGRYYVARGGTQFRCAP